MTRSIQVLLCCSWLLTMIWSIALAGGKVKVKDAPLLKEHKWQEAEEHYAKKLVELGEQRSPRRDKELLELSLCYNIARYFPQMSDENASALADWLLGEPDFTAELLSAFDPKDSPPRAFGVLTQLKDQCGKKTVLKSKGLAIAHALVWDRKEPISEAFDATDSFEFYIDNARKMTFDVLQMHYQAALFLACAQASPGERLWALGKYGRQKSLSVVYQSVPYDMGGLLGKPKRIAVHEYTLQNLLQHGGVCADRAYFATNVARSRGIPAAWICGIGDRGGHAWMGHIKAAKRGGYAWNLACGRYAQDRYYIGITRDPQTGKQIFDYQVAMRTRECSLAPEKVRTAACYVCLAEVLEKAEKPGALKWALEQALKNNRFSLKAWDHLTRLCEEGTFGADYADEIMGRALKTFPDEPGFCYGVFKSMMGTIPKEQFARRTRLYQQAAKFFSVRPDLTVSIGGEFGDYLLEMGKKREAYEVYHNTIRAHMGSPRLVTDIAIKVTEKRMEEDEPKKAVSLLKALMKSAKRPFYGDPFAKYSVWYRLHKCLKDIYEEMGQQKAADAIGAELSRFKVQ